MLKKQKQGFSLIEVLLVIGIISIFSFIKMQEVQEEQLSAQAKTIAAQMQQIGQATNAYINLNYDKIIAMNNIPSGKDGLLACDKGRKTCNITIETLKRNFLLPEQFTGVNLMKSGYDITLKVEGTAPNYQINGLVVTDKGLNLKQNKNAILLGKTIQYAGIDSGFSKTNNEISGLAGAWKESAVKYHSIKQEGQLAYQVGYSSNMYSIYLRRDGTLPMTGDLNLDEHNIKNIANAYIHKDLFVDGKADVKGDIYSGKTINAKGDINSDKVVRAKAYFEGFNGTNDRFRIGGNDGNDYEFALYHNTKPLTIWRPSTPSSNNIILNTYGGIETLNGGQILASGNITSNQKIIAKSDIESDATIKGKDVVSLNRMTVGEFLKFNKSVNVGDSCLDVGLFSRDPNGELMTCINNKWDYIVYKEHFIRLGENNLSVTSPGNYKYIIVSISSKFSGRDGSHYRFADFNVKAGGQIVGTIKTDQYVSKGGSRGHSWVYEGYAFSQKSFSRQIKRGELVSISLKDSDYHIKSDIRVEFVN